MHTSLPRRLLWAGAAMTAVSVLAVTAFLVAPRAYAEGGGGYFPPPQDKIVQKECASCHMAYPAGMLPARSWRAIMSRLDNHFGENASLDKATTKHITDYLVAHAADTGGRTRWTMRGIGANDVPLRISDTPWWTRAHWGEVSPRAFKNPKVGSKANCVACHRGAAQGLFGEQE